MPHVDALCSPQLPGISNKDLGIENYLGDDGKYKDHLYRLKAISINMLEGGEQVLFLHLLHI